MYKIIEIGGNEYKREFSIEASLYKDCTEKLIHFINDATATQRLDVTGLSPEMVVAKQNEAMQSAISGMSDMPNLAMTLWYAGFMEHHGVEGDGTVTSMRAAKELYKQYHAEHPDNSSFYEIVADCIEQMSDDGFFDLIGLNKMNEQVQAMPTTKKPQDHRRKATAKS